MHHDPKVGWDFCCGVGGVEYRWLRTFSFGIFNKVVCKLFNLFPMTPDLIGVVVVAQVALKIFGS